MIEHDEIVQSIRDSAVRKTGRQDVAAALVDIDATADNVIAAIKDGSWRRPDVNIDTINENTHRKTRIIYRPHWYCEQIVHHAIVWQLKCIMRNRIYPHSYGSVSRDFVRMRGGKPVKDKSGPHQAVKVMDRWVHEYGNKRFYVAELDIQQFYASVNQDTLMGLLRKNIRDRKFLDLIAYAIEPFDGLPLGNLLSPWLAAYYLMGMDEFILQELKPDHYLRYVDNLWLFSTNKRKLHQKVLRLTNWLQTSRGLTFNRSRQIFRFESAKLHQKNGKEYCSGRAINAMGFVIHRDRIGVRKGILKRARRKANRIRKKGCMTWYDAAQISSRMSYLRHANVYGYYHKWILPEIDISACRGLVAMHQRKVALRGNARKLRYAM